MGATIFRLLREGRTRHVVITLAMVAWFALILGVIRGAVDDITAQTEMMGGALSKGFGLGPIADPDSLVAQMIGVSFNHPILLALVGAVTVAPGARACQGELHAGTLDVTLARAVSRTRYLLAYVIVIALLDAVLMLASWLAMVGFDRILDVPGTLDAGRAALLCLESFIVFLDFGAIAVLVSVLLGRRASAMSTTIGVLVVMFALTFANRAWETDVLDWLDHLSIFHWLDATGIMQGVPLAANDLLVPLAIAVACVSIALWRFERRDL
jgi:ABC-type transport system involved in multi-copper enzyme maturation permease subunit